MTRGEKPAGEATARARLGASGERLAAATLERAGYVVIARNWRCPYGELDLVAEHGAELVFVEVKTRRGTRMGSPEEAVTPAKRRKLLASAQTWLAERGEEQRAYRFDVVAIELEESGRLVAVRVHRNALQEE
ncbi:MAG TPA: YraN family protein [Ktedonobacterales bacterium]|nr:YraN family protein [Ktedonobacterales bacterium]